MSGLGCCVPTGGCWRQLAGPTRLATSFGWVLIAGAPKAPLCFALRRWPRAQSPFSPRGCLCEVGPAGGGGAPPPTPLKFTGLFPPPVPHLVLPLHLSTASCMQRALAWQSVGPKLPPGFSVLWILGCMKPVVMKVSRTGPTPAPQLSGTLPCPRESPKRLQRERGGL